MAGRKHAAKGNAYERELAAYLTKELGIPVGRAPLSGGGAGHRNAFGPGADLVGVPDLHVEAKRVESLSWRAALEQAEKSASADETPVVITRRNREPTGESKVIMNLDNFLPFYRAWLAQEGIVADERREPTVPAPCGGPKPEGGSLPWISANGGEQVMFDFEDPAYLPEKPDDDSAFIEPDLPWWYDEKDRPAYADDPLPFSSGS